MGVLVSRVDRVEGIRLFLSRTLAWPDNVTELRIPRPPFLVGTKFSNIEARWLQDELAGVGVVAEVVVPEKVGFRLSSLIFILLFSTIFFLGLLWFRVNETLSQSGPGVFALFNISIIIPLGAGMVFALRYLQVSPLQLPKFWITGLAAIGGSTLQKSRFEANSRRGFILLVLLLALALFVASYGSFISCFPMGIYELRRGSPESFLLLVLGIGPILIWKLLYGRLTYRKLSSIELPVSDSAKFHQLEKLRIALDEVRLPEFRFLVSRIVETSLAARRIPDSGAGSELEDVLGECIQAAHLTSTIFARLTLQGAVGGIAEEVKYQAARLEIERRLNLLRNCIGSMVTAVARHAWEKGSPENHSRWRDSLALLKAQLVEVTAL
jgi:hypothetical protein